MSTLKDQQNSVLSLLNTSRYETFSRDHDSLLDSPDIYVYFSPLRPLWGGLLQNLIDDSNFIGMIGPAKTFIQTKNPLPLDLLLKTELVPLSLKARRDLVSKVFKSKLSLSIYNNKTGDLSLAWSKSGKFVLSNLSVKNSEKAVLKNEQEFDTLDQAVVHKLSSSLLGKSLSGNFAVIDDDLVHRRLDVRMDSRMIVNELAAIRRKQHPAYLSGSDSVNNSNDYLWQLVEKQQDRAQAITNEIGLNITYYSNESGLSPDRIQQFASIINEQIRLKSRRVTAQNTKTNEVSMSKKQRWIDLSAHGVYLGDQKMADSRSRLVVLDMNNRGDIKRLEEIGFLPLKGSPRYEKGIYYLHGEDQKMRPKALAAAFGLNECPLVDVDPKEIDQVFREKISEKFAANINSIVLRSTPLGQNKGGQLVFASPTGRFIRLSQDNAISETSEQGKKLGKTAFLHGTTDAELRECAFGFIWNIRQGSKMAWPDLMRFGKSVFDTPKGEEPTHEQMHRLQEAVEAAGYQRFSDIASKPDEAAFKGAMDFYYGLPSARMRTSESVLLQQYSTPLPMSVVAQRLLIGEDKVKGKSAYDPTAGNGGLLNLLSSDMTKYAVELDKKRYEALLEIGDIKASLSDALSFQLRSEFDANGVDYVISNPPFGEMNDIRSFDKLVNIKKLDHYIPLKALEARKDQGRAVIIFGADSTQSDGTLKGGSKKFLNYVYDHYDVHGLVEIDGRLYSRHGAGFNVRMLVIGDKRAEPIVAVVPEQLEIISTYDELWQWSSNVIEQYAQPSSLDLNKLKFVIGDDVRFTPYIKENSFSSGVIEGKVIDIIKLVDVDGINFKYTVKSDSGGADNDGSISQTFYLNEGQVESLISLANKNEEDISLDLGVDFGDAADPIFGNKTDQSIIDEVVPVASTEAIIKPIVNRVVSDVQLDLLADQIDVSIETNLAQEESDIELSASNNSVEVELLSEASNWINTYFSEEAIVGQGRIDLASYLSGDGRFGSFKGMVDRSWLQGLAALGMSVYEVEEKSVDDILHVIWSKFQSSKLDNELDNNDAFGNKILLPWELTKEAWDDEISNGAGKDAATNEARRTYLRYEVLKWASDKLELSKLGNIKLSDEELAEVTDRLNTPVTHRDVIDKALSEGMKVPMEVLSDYPDLSMPSDRHVNEFQVPYQSASKTGEPSTMMPINMAGSTYAALNRLETRFGSIDEYVASKLQYDVNELPAYFSCEQIDAIGLGIKAVEEGRGIINADQTGIGKGRFVAAMLRYAKLHDKTPVFLTIKPELFTDIFRDISDIGSLHLFKKLFIFNDGEYVRKFGTEKDVLFPKTSDLERKNAIAAGAIEDDVDMVLATYSQLMRSYANNPKAKLLTDIVRKNGMLLLDESHVASGASNLSSTVSQAVSNSKSVLYSSATPLKGVSNFGIYSKVLPASVNLSTLGETLKTGGEALQEAISANMARDGVLIRREHDFSKLTFHTRVPSEKRRERNVMLANELSSILADLSYLSGDVNRIVSKLNKGYKSEWENIPERDRAGYRMQASSMNFGSRLYSINRQFLLGVKIEDAVEEALSTLKNGLKPIIAVENTGESLLRQVIAKRAGVGDLEAELLEIDERGANKPEDKLRREFLVSSINDAMRNVTLESAPQFRELLELMLDRVGVIKLQGRYGEYTRTTPDSKEYIEQEAYLREKIRQFPDLPLTPIDIIKKELELNGHPVAEVSGRTASIKPNTLDSKHWDVNFHPKVDAVSNVAGFQNGKYDCIVITRSGSTGISLHATDRFVDSDIRQRNFIVLQKAANIAEFLQWMGRANRKDQVIPPVITGIESGLPAELRLTMMHNTKLRKLSANTTSNRDNVNIEGENLDLLNDVGDRIALDWLVENPDMAEALDITLPHDDELEDLNRFSQDAPYINKIMGRLAMVNVAKQEEILRVLTNRFADRIEELEQRGENPFKIDVRDWKAKIIHEENLQNGVIRASSSSFDEPVKMVTVQYEQTIFPVKSEKLVSMISMGMESYKAMAPEGEDDPVRKLKSYVLSVKDTFIRSQLPMKLRESTEPLYALLDGKDVMAAKNAKERSDYLIANMQHLKPGMRLVYDDVYKGERQGVIVSVQFPSHEDEIFLLSKYRARVMFPGEDHSQEITLATIKSQGKDLASHAWMNIDPSVLHESHNKRKVQNIFDAFDEAPEGKLIRTQYLLQGNLFRACELAVQEKLGSPILYTDTDGNRQRAVHLKSFVTPEMVKSLPLALSAKDTADYIKEFLRPNHPEFSTRTRFGNFRIFSSGVKDMKHGDGIMFEVLNGGQEFRLTMPGTKARAGALMTDGSIFNIGENTPKNSMGLKLSGTKVYMSVDVSRRDLPKLLELMEINKHIGKFYIPVPDHDVIEILKDRYQKEVEARQGSKFQVEIDDGLSP